MPRTISFEKQIEELITQLRSNDQPRDSTTLEEYVLLMDLEDNRFKAYTYLIED